VYLRRGIDLLVCLQFETCVSTLHSILIFSFVFYLSELAHTHLHAHSSGTSNKLNINPLSIYHDQPTTHEQQQPKPHGTLIATTKRGDTIRSYFSYDPNQNASLLSSGPVYYDNDGNEVPGDSVASFSSGFPYTCADLAAANNMFLPTDKTFDVGRTYADTYPMKHRKSAEHKHLCAEEKGREKEGLERRGENVSDPPSTSSAEVNVTSTEDTTNDTITDSNTTPLFVHRYILTAPDGRTWRFGDEMDETALRDLVGDRFDLSCICPSGLFTTYRPLTTGGELEAEELGMWFNESGPGLHCVLTYAPRGQDRMAACTRPHDEPIAAPFHYGKRKVGDLDGEREDADDANEERKCHCDGAEKVHEGNEELLRIEEDVNSLDSSESSRTLRRSDASSDSSYTIGRSEDKASSPASSDESYTVGRSEAGSEKASSELGDESDEDAESDDEADVSSKSYREGAMREEVGVRQ
jgi:hypothetical protein